MNRDKGVGEKSKADQSDLDGTFLLFSTLVSSLIPSDDRLMFASNLEKLIALNRDSHRGEDKAFARRATQFIQIMKS